MSTHQLKYPYQWAKVPVNSFVEKYARGTYNLSLLTDYPPGMIRHRLCLCLAKGNSLLWESIKRVIITLEDYHGDDLRHLSDENRRLLYKNLRYDAENSVLNEKND